MEAVFDVTTETMAEMSAWADRLYRETAAKLLPATKPNGFVPRRSLTASKPKEDNGEGISPTDRGRNMPGS